jgi:hypothetical protein
MQLLDEPQTDITKLVFSLRMKGTSGNNKKRKIGCGDRI